MRDVKWTDQNWQWARLWDTWVRNTPEVSIDRNFLLFHIAQSSTTARVTRSAIKKKGMSCKVCHKKGALWIFVWPKNFHMSKIPWENFHLKFLVLFNLGPDRICYDIVAPLLLFTNDTENWNVSLMMIDRMKQVWFLRSLLLTRTGGCTKRHKNNRCIYWSQSAQLCKI